VVWRGLAGDLGSRRAARAGAEGAPYSAKAAKVATTTIPIVCVSGSDPVKEGLVASLNKPGGNATGVNPMLAAMEAKRLGLLREIIPNAALVAVLLNPVSQDNFSRQLNDVQGAARDVWAAAPRPARKQRRGDRGSVRKSGQAPSQRGARRCRPLPVEPPGAISGTRCPLCHSSNL